MSGEFLRARLAASRLEWYKFVRDIGLLEMGAKMKWSIVAIACLMAVSPALRAEADGAAPPLIAAAKSGDAATVIQLLGQGVDPNSRDEIGSALEWAAVGGHLDAVKALLDGHAAVDGAYAPYKFTPLMRAAAAGRPDVVAYLLAHGADANLQAVDRSTALSLAEANNHADIANVLREHGAIVVTGSAHVQASGEKWVQASSDDQYSWYNANSVSTDQNGITHVTAVNTSGGSPAKIGYNGEPQEFLLNCRDRTHWRAKTGTWRISTGLPYVLLKAVCP